VRKQHDLCVSFVRDDVEAAEESGAAVFGDERLRPFFDLDSPIVLEQQRVAQTRALAFEAMSEILHARRELATVDQDAPGRFAVMDDVACAFCRRLRTMTRRVHRAI